MNKISINIKLVNHMVRHKQFFIIFRDKEKRDLNAYEGDTGKLAIENILSSIHYNLGLEHKIAGKLTTFSLWLIRNIPGEGDDDIDSDAGPIFRYGHFFKLDSDGEGYDERMFCRKMVRKMTGYQKF